MVNYKKWIKRGFLRSGLLSLARRLKGPRTLILRYHSVKADPDAYADSLGRGIIHSADAFRAQMEWLARTFEPVGLDDVAASVQGRRPMPGKGVVVTFDDGYADNAEVAAPVLERLGMRGAFYVTTGCVELEKVPWFCRLRHAFAVTAAEEWREAAGERVRRLAEPQERRQAFLSASASCARQAGAAQDALIERIECELAVESYTPPEQLMLSWEQARELRGRGHVVGSHTVTHPNLAQTGADEISREFGESKKLLEEKLGEPVCHFSYPSPILQPHWDERTVACCREHGYETAVTCTPGPVLAADSPLCLKRIAAPERLDDFKWAVENAFLGRCV